MQIAKKVHKKSTIRKRNSKLTFLEAVEKALSDNIAVAGSPHSNIIGIDKAQKEITKFILSDFKRRANQLKNLVKNVTHDTRESQNAEFLEKLIKEYSGKDEWIYDYGEGLYTQNNEDTKKR